MKNIFSMLLAAVLFSACAGESAQAPKAPAPSAIAPQTARSLNAGSDADFVGNGTEPFWGIEIDFDESMKFQPMEGEEILTPVPEPTLKSDGTLIYEAQAEGATLKVSYKKQPCNNGMSDVEFPYTVSVEVDGNVFTGCGTYQKGALGAYWVLTAINGAAPSKKDFPQGKYPTLLINLSDSSYSGSDGCNIGGGKLSLDGSNIGFEEGISTMMACPGEGDKVYKEALYKVTSYNIDGTTLRLMDAEGKEVLTFGL